MIGIHKLNINWTDDNHAHVQDPDTGFEFDVTVRPKENRFVGGRPVKSRLYVGGIDPNNFHSLGKYIDFVQENFIPTLSKLLNRDIYVNYSRKAGCSCGCSPGFIIQDSGDLPFDIWMDTKT